MNVVDWNSVFCDSPLRIEKQENKYGIINRVNGNIIIPFEYDNLFYYWNNTFICIKNGKFGAFEIDDSERIKTISLCEYDLVTPPFSKSLILYGTEKCTYYNIYNGATIECGGFDCLNDKFIIGRNYTKNESYLIVEATGKIIYTYNDSNAQFKIIDGLFSRKLLISSVLKGKSHIVKKKILIK